ncbi:MAG: sigma 54-interacting transcriptional regulator [Polyangiaceae bacterium]|nr:sigma 54-interacting transcriptional regulator [Polyangiaceae bacterium]
MEQQATATAPTRLSPPPEPPLPARPLRGIRWVFPGNAHAPTVAGTEPTVVGRSRKCCGHRLDGPQVSGQHAVVRKRRGGFGILIRDYPSKNGVYVNGRRIPPDEERELSAGDVVRLGEFVGIVDSLATGDVGRPLPVECRQVAMPCEAEGENKGRRAAKQLLHIVIGPATRGEWERIELAAATGCSVIIIGETGCGKEYVAKALHAWSKCTGHYVGLNCSELKGDPGLARARLFGVEAGAFAGAVPTKGALRDAHGGTLLLDEIVDLPVEAQPLLLRAVQERLVHPVGAKRPVEIDVRLVVAAQRSLAQEVREGRFREDLYQRLNDLTVELPALRERRVEIPFLFLTALAASFSTAQGARASSPIDPAEVDPCLIEQLCLYRWPGNVRELTKVARYLRHFGDQPAEAGYRFRKASLPAELAFDPPPEENGARDQKDAIDLRRLIDAIRDHDGHIKPAAAQLGMDRARAYRLGKRWGTLAAKGAIEAPRDEFERGLRERFLRGGG